MSKYCCKRSEVRDEVLHNKDALESLGCQEKVILLRYCGLEGEYTKGDYTSMIELGKEFRVKRERIFQIVMKARKKLEDLK